MTDGAFMGSVIFHTDIDDVAAFKETVKADMVFFWREL